MAVEAKSRNRSHSLAQGHGPCPGTAVCLDLEKRP